MLATAAMRDQDEVRVRLGIVGDEESEEEAERGSDHLVDSGFLGDFAITGEPTDLHIGVEAKGVLALRVQVERRRRPRRHALARRQRRSAGRSTFSAVSSRYRSHGTARSCSTAPRSISAGSWAGTRSTRCPTDAPSTSTSATCPIRTPLRAGAGARASPTPRWSRSSPARRPWSTATCPTCGRCARRPRRTTTASR